MLRTTDSGRDFSSKTFRELPRIKGSSDSNEINACATLFKNLNKELCAVDHTGNATNLKGTIELTLLSMLRKFRSFIILKHLYITEKLRAARHHFPLQRGEPRSNELGKTLPTFKSLEPT